MPESFGFKMRDVKTLPASHAHSGWLAERRLNCHDSGVSGQVLNRPGHGLPPDAVIE